MKQSCKTFTITLIALLTLLGAAQPYAEYEEILYYHTDALGSPVLATKADGTEKWREEYAPYGSRLLLQSREITGSPPVPVESPWDEKQWFTGKLEETRVGLQYFGARWYDPEIGRFLSPDPVQYTQGTIYSFNRYAYANNNPYRYTDPDGQSPIDVVFLAVDVGRLAAAVYSGDTSAVQSAAVDVAFSAVGVVVPIPGAGQALKAAKVASKVESVAGAASGTKSAVKSVEDVTTGVKPKFGSLAGDGAGKRFPSKVKDQARAESNDTCVFCGTKTTREPGPTQSEIDHSIPKSRGGNSSPENAQNTCRTCNRRKGAKTSEEFSNR